MGSTTIYLLPEEKSIDPKQYRSRVKSVLLKMGVIDKELYDDEPNWYEAGENSTSPFKEVDPGDLGFEYCIIHASPYVDVVPQDPAVEPRCPKSKADVSDAFYETVNDITEVGGPKKQSEKLLQARIVCPKCKRSSALTELKDRVGIFLSGTWVNFEDVPSKLLPKWLKTFNDETGWRHKALTYWYT